MEIGQKPPLKIAIYARVSTLMQTADSQLVTLREYAANRGFEIVEEFVDVGHSGSKDSRPELDRMMKMVRSRRFKGIKGVLVFRFDRFARSSKHLALALEEFQERGIKFMSYTENVDMTTSMGQAMFSIIAAMAQLERDIIKERVASGLKAAVAKGKVLGRPKTVREELIRAMLLAGNKSIREIAAEANTSHSSVSRIAREMKVQDNMKAAVDGIAKL